MRIIGIDYGASRTGVAVSDELGFMAHRVETISDTSRKNVIDRIKNLAEKYEAGIIVVGLPKNMNNTIGQRGIATLKFIELLKESVSCRVIPWDERLSTVSAINILSETDIRGKKRKATVDAVAAEIILQGYLDYKNSKSAANYEEEV